VKLLICAAAFLFIALIASCATSPTGRKQLMLVSDGDVNQLGAQSFTQLKQQSKISQNSKQTKFVDCIADAVIAAAQGKPNVPATWEVTLFDSPDINAFALPGGKIGVYTGLLKVTKTDAQLATVLAHEVGHVISRHGAERMSQQMASQTGLLAAGMSTSSPYVVAALGAATQYGVLLPFSRSQETEADEVGLQLMAEAGFDPRQSVELWKNMQAASGGKTPSEFFSTHPSDPTRISNLEAHMPEAIELYEQARASGKNPRCPIP
jgi:predicted Zn-dependent protease